ncbi:hypothetical protein HZS_8106 [Henneguya salminicola]|nr:hypothetical protein HZS_8106 [Henneguya salminicola]
MVIKSNGIQNPHYLAWQSKVGIAQWLQPETEMVIESLIQSGQGNNGILIAPISFTSDHIETAYDIDIEMRNKFKKMNSFF